MNKKRIEELVERRMRFLKIIGKTSKVTPALAAEFQSLKKNIQRLIYGRNICATEYFFELIDEKICERTG